MPVTYIYRIPLYGAYKFSLVDDGSSRPDQLDEEGTLYRIITSDEKQRLVKIEEYPEGDLRVERSFFYDGDRKIRIEEAYPETGTKSEIRYRHESEGEIAEYYTDGTLERKEIITKNAEGVVTGSRLLDAAGQCTVSWEANEHGDQVHLKDGEHEAVFEHRYNDDGLRVESIYREGEQEFRDVYHYRNKDMVKREVFAVGFVSENQDPASAPETAEVLINEESVDLDPQGRFKVLKRRQLVASGSEKEHRDAKYWPSKIEILYDNAKRITDVLTCDATFLETVLGIECEPNAYYFFEYEEAAASV